MCDIGFDAAAYGILVRYALVTSSRKARCAFAGGWAKYFPPFTDSHTVDGGGGARCTKLVYDAVEI